MVLQLRRGKVVQDASGAQHVRERVPQPRVAQGHSTSPALEHPQAKTNVLWTGPSSVGPLLLQQHTEAVLELPEGVVGTCGAVLVRMDFEAEQLEGLLDLRRTRRRLEPSPRRLSLASCLQVQLLCVCMYRGQICCKYMP